MKSLRRGWTSLSCSCYTLVALLRWRGRDIDRMTFGILHTDDEKGCSSSHFKFDGYNRLNMVLNVSPVLSIPLSVHSFLSVCIGFIRLFFMPAEFLSFLPSSLSLLRLTVKGDEIRKTRRKTRCLTTKTRGNEGGCNWILLLFTEKERFLRKVNMGREERMRVVCPVCPLLLSHTVKKLSRQSQDRNTWQA